MSDTDVDKITKTLVKFLDKANQGYTSESLKAYNDALLYLEGIVDTGSSEIQKDAQILSLVLQNSRQLTKYAISADKKMEQMRIDLNNALGRIKRIEEARGFDNPEKMK